MDYAWKDWKTGGKTVAQNFNAFEDSKLGIPVCSMHLLAVKWVGVGARGVTELIISENKPNNVVYFVWRV